MEKSQRENVVRPFRVVHEAKASHYILEGEVGALAPGDIEMRDPEGSHYKRGSLI